MKEAIKISAVVATALLLAACAKKEEAAAPMPEPAASAPVETAPAEAAPAEAAPTGEVPAADAAAATDAAGDAERAGGDGLHPRPTSDAAQGGSGAALRLVDFQADPRAP